MLRKRQRVVASFLAAAATSSLRTPLPVAAATDTERSFFHEKLRVDREETSSALRRSSSGSSSPPATATSTATKLRSSLCVDSMCSRDCIAYRTPLNSCYNGAKLFPGDPSWGEFDVLDRVDDQILGGLRPSRYGEGELELDAEYEPFWGDGSFGRYFYATTNGTCGGDPTDSFEDLPVGECVGPFGAPRPWGAFSFVDGTSPSHGGEGIRVERIDDRGGGTDGEESEDR